MSFNFDITFPTVYTQVLKWVYGVFNFDFFFFWNISLNFAPLGCIFDLHYWRRTASSAFLLMVVMGGLLAYYRFLRLRGNRILPNGKKAVKDAEVGNLNVEEWYEQTGLESMKMSKLRKIKNDLTSPVSSGINSSHRGSVGGYIAAQGLSKIKKSADKHKKKTLA